MLLISPEDFDRWVERDRFLKAIELGLNDSEKGTIVSDEESKDALESEFGNLD